MEQPEEPMSLLTDTQWENAYQAFQKELQRYGLENKVTLVQYEGSISGPTGLEFLKGDVSEESEQLLSERQDDDEYNWQEIVIDFTDIRSRL